MDASNRGGRYRRDRARAGLLAGLGGAALLILAGCAASLSPGQRLLREQSYVAAAEALSRETAERPQEWTLRRDHAVALLESGRAADAVGPLRSLRIERPEEASVAFQLGRASEAVSDFDGALTAYQDYLALGGKGGTEIAARRQRLTLRKIETDVRKALARESELANVPAPENSVAVPDFANPARVDSLAPLGRGLAAMLITDLSHSERLILVERARINVLLDELARSGATGDTPRNESEGRATPPDLDTPAGARACLQSLASRDGSGSYLDPAASADEAAFVAAVRRFQRDHGLSTDGKIGPRTKEAMRQAWNAAMAPATPPAPQPAFSAEQATRVGRLLRARRFVQGSFLPLAGDRVQLDAGILDAAGGGLLSAGPPVEGPMPGVLRLAKTLTLAIYDAFGISLDAESRRALGMPPTEDLDAFLAFSRGLMLEDEGRYPEASAAYSEALDRDPAFALAAARLEVTSVSSEQQSQLDRRETQGVTRRVDAPTSTLIRGAQLIGGGPVPNGTGGDPGGPEDPDPVGPINDAVEIVIEGTIPGGNR